MSIETPNTDTKLTLDDLPKELVEKFQRLNSAMARAKTLGRAALEARNGVQGFDPALRAEELGKLPKADLVAKLVALEQKMVRPAKTKGKGVKEIVLAVFSDPQCACLGSKHVAAVVNELLLQDSTTPESVSSYMSADLDVKAALVPRIKL